jgi:hypothetical protein
VMREMCWPTIRTDGSLNIDSILDFQTWSIEKGLAEKALPIEEIVDNRFVEFAAAIRGQSE